MIITTRTRRFKRDWLRCCRCCAANQRGNYECCRIVHSAHSYHFVIAVWRAKDAECPEHSEKLIVSTKDNKALVIRYIQEVLNEGKVELVDSLCAPELLIHLPNFPEMLHGRQVLKQLIHYNRIIFPDGQVRVEDMIAEQDKVSARGTFRGTYHGAPLERRIADEVKPIVVISGIAIFRILSGKMICEMWHEENFIEAMRQLGIPAAFPPELALAKGVWQN
jgi:predicted ester cyclase